MIKQILYIPRWILKILATRKDYFPSAAPRENNPFLVAIIFNIHLGMYNICILLNILNVWSNLIAIHKNSKIVWRSHENKLVFSRSISVINPSSQKPGFPSWRKQWKSHVTGPGWRTQRSQWRRIEGYFLCLRWANMFIYMNIQCSGWNKSW